MSAVVVIGGGVDGLVAATRLARAGRAVVVVEQRREVGGVCAGGSFGGSFRHTGRWCDTVHFRPALAKELRLTECGLRFVPPADSLAVEADGPGIAWTSDSYKTERDLARRAAGDVDGLARLQAWVERTRPVIEALVDAPPTRLEGSAPLTPLVKQALGMRRMGARDMLELLQVGPAAAEDLLASYVQDPLLRAAMIAPSLLGTRMGPNAPHSAGIWLLYEALTGAYEVDGGPAGLVSALHVAAERAGVRFRLGAAARRVRVEAGAVVAVETSEGDLDSRAVLSAIGPRRTLLDLVDPMLLPSRVVREARALRVRGSWAVIHLGLSGPPQWRSRPGVAFGRVHVGASPTELDRAMDDANAGRLPEKPFLDVRVLPASCAPAGQAALTVQLSCVPYHLEGGWTAEARQRLLDRVLATLAEHAPHLPGQVVASEVLTPRDLEAELGLEGGHPLHGEIALDQLWALRPTPALAGYHTPIKGLFLGSSGTHPGVGRTGASGALAAKALLAGA